MKPYKILITGSFCSGKSTLVNALASHKKHRGGWIYRSKCRGYRYRDIRNTSFYCVKTIGIYVILFGLERIYNQPICRMIDTYINIDDYAEGSMRPQIDAFFVLSMEKKVWYMLQI